MNVGVLIPGFSASERDWCIPVYLNFVRQLAEQDSVSVFALRYPPRHSPYPVYRAKVIPLNGGSYTAGFGRIRLWFRAWAAIQREHRQRRFDVLHAIWADETGLIAQWAGRLLHIPSVVSIAGGELAGIADIGYGLHLSRFSRWIVGQALRADQVIAPCNYTAVLARPWLNPDRLRIVPLGVATSLFMPLMPSIPSSHRNLIAVGSISAVKDHAAALRVLANIPTSDTTLTIVGDRGNGELYRELRREAEALGIANRVHFRDAVDHGDLPGVYQSADLHLLTSRYEAFGMVTAEAAACGLPTVGLARGILPELAAAGGGIAVVPDSHAAQNLAVAIESLFNDATQLSSMRREALAFVNKKLTLDRMVDGIRVVYRAAISRKRT